MSAPPNPPNGAPRTANGQPVGVAGQQAGPGVRPNLLPPNVSNQDFSGVLNEAVANVLSARVEMFRKLFDPRRDLASECGWPADESNYGGGIAINPDLYRMLYDREPLATRIVQLMPEECWQKPPFIYEIEDPDVETPFESAVLNLSRAISPETSWYNDSSNSGLWQMCKKADMMSRIGAFGIILIGVADGKNLEEPADGVVVQPTFNSDGTVTINSPSSPYGVLGSRYQPLPFPDSYLAEHEEKALLDPKPSKCWNGKYHSDGKAMLEDRTPPPLNEAEKLIVNRWRGEREFVVNAQRVAAENQQRAQEAALNAARKGQSQWGGIGPNPQPISVPDSLKGGPGSENNPAQSYGGGMGAQPGSAFGFVPGTSPSGNPYMGQAPAIPGTFQPPYVPRSDPASPLQSGPTLPLKPSAGIKGMGGAYGGYAQGAGLGGVGGSVGGPNGGGSPGVGGPSGAGQLGGPYGPGGSLSGTDAQYFGVITGPTEIPSPEPATYPEKQRPKITFLRVFDESLVQIVRYEWNVNNPRFGKPVMYRITLNDPREQHSGVGLPMSTVFVHWSRVIHVADTGKGPSEVFAVPTMRPCLNRVLDARKIYGSSAEGYYKSCFQGLQFSTHPQLGGDVILDTASLKDQVEQYWNGLQRVLMSAGGQWSTLAPSVVDPTAQIDKQIEAICIVLGCPVRVFKGSERGELASSQDDEAWNERKMERQNNYLTPRIVVPLIDRLILMGVLPEPGSGKGPDNKPPTKNRLHGTYPGKVTRITRYLHPDGKYRREFGGSLKDLWLAENIRANGRGERPIYNLADPDLEKGSTKVDTDTDDEPGYSVEWPDLDALGDQARATILGAKTTALQAYVSGQCETVMPVKDWLTRWAGFDDEEAEAIIEGAKSAAESEETAPLTMPAPGERGHPATPPPKPPKPIIAGGGPPGAGAPPGQGPPGQPQAGPPGGQGSGAFQPQVKAGNAPSPTGNELTTNEGWVTLHGGQHVYIGGDGGVYVKGPKGSPTEHSPFGGKPPKASPSSPSQTGTKGGESKAEEGGIPKHLEEHAAEAIANLNPKERQAIRDYTGSGYEKMNATMRSCPPDFSCLTGEDKADYEHIENALSRSPKFKEPVQVHRGVSLSPHVAAGLLKDAEDSQKGKEKWAMPSLTSTSASKGAAESFASPLYGGGAKAKVLYKITAKSGLYLESMTQIKGEHEVLQSANTRYKVARVDRHGDGGGTIHLHEI